MTLDTGPKQRTSPWGTRSEAPEASAEPFTGAPSVDKTDPQAVQV
jgi:hypothetical protein